MMDSQLETRDMDAYAPFVHVAGPLLALSGTSSNKTLSKTLVSTGVGRPFDSVVRNLPVNCADARPI